MDVKINHVFLYTKTGFDYEIFYATPTIFHVTNIEKQKKKLRNILAFPIHFFDYDYQT